MTLVSPSDVLRQLQLQPKYDYLFIYKQTPARISLKSGCIKILRHFRVKVGEYAFLMYFFVLNPFLLFAKL